MLSGARREGPEDGVQKPGQVVEDEAEVVASTAQEGGIGSIYDRYSYAEENRRVQEAVAERIMSPIERPKVAPKVVRLIG